MLDVAAWNAYYLYKQCVKRNDKYEYVDYRDQAETKNLNRVPAPTRAVESSDNNHWPVRVPAKDGTKRHFTNAKFVREISYIVP